MNGGQTFNEVPPLILANARYCTLIVTAVTNPEVSTRPGSGRPATKLSEPVQPARGDHDLLVAGSTSQVPATRFAAFTDPGYNFRYFLDNDHALGIKAAQ